MKVIQGFKLRSLGTDFILVPQSGGLVNFNKLISLNRTAAYLWESVASMDTFDVGTLTGLLVEKYQIDEETAAADARKISVKWIEAGIVEEL